MGSRHRKSKHLSEPEIALHGRMAWQRRHGYGKRSKVETAISRIKRINDGRLTSRTFGSQRNEVAIHIAIANRNADREAALRARPLIPSQSHRIGRSPQCTSTIVHWCRRAAHLDHRASAPRALCRLAVPSVRDTRAGYLSPRAPRLRSRRSRPAPIHRGFAPPRREPLPRAFHRLRIPDASSPASVHPHRSRADAALGLPLRAVEVPVCHLTP